MCPTYTYYCNVCQHVTDGLFRMAERPDMVKCDNCGEESRYRISMPNIMSAALPDGTKRKGWDVMKEAAKLNVEAAGSKDGKKKEIAKEIKKLGVKVGGSIL